MDTSRQGRRLRAQCRTESVCLAVLPRSRVTLTNHLAQLKDDAIPQLNVETRPLLDEDTYDLDYETDFEVALRKRRMV